MIEIYLFLGNNLTYSASFHYEKDGTDFLNLNTPSYPVKNLPYSELFEDLDYGVSILHPTSDGEDFIYDLMSEYLRNHFHVSNEEIIGHKYSEVFYLFAHNLRILDLMKKAYFDNERIDYKHAIFVDGELKYTLDNTLLREDDLLILTSIMTSAAVNKFDLDIFNEYTQGSFIIQNKKIVCKNSAFNLMEHDNGSLRPFTFEDIKFEGLTYNEWLNIYDKILSCDLLNYNGSVRYSNYITGDTTYYDMYLSFTLFENKAAIKVNLTDVTNFRQEETNVRRLEEHLYNVNVLNKCAILRSNSKGNLYWTPEIYNLLEMSIDEISRVKDNENVLDRYVSENERKKFYDWAKNAKTDDDVYKSQFKVVTSKNHTKYFYVSAIVKHDDEDYNSTYLVSLVRDITDTYVGELELKEKNKQLEDLLEDKKMLLREVHHRVKNNLQIILSYLCLDLHFNRDNPNVTIHNTRDRINSMALMYNKTLKYNAVDLINIHDFLKSLVSKLIEVYSYGKIKVNLNVIDKGLDIDIVTPLGLIINELVLNTIKYAFPDNCEGELNILFTNDKNNYKLVISDNGIGLPEDLNITNPSTLGMVIVQTLTQQLEGSFTNLKPSNGMALQIIFPKK